MAYKNLLVSNHGKIARITLNRPEKLNALNFQTLKSLQKAIDDVAGDQDLRILIIDGRGDNAFCVGADLNYLNSLKDGKDASNFVDTVQELYNSIQGLEKPVIAAIHGYCLGGGCELAMACDIRIASKDAKFGQPEIRLGIIPGGGGTYRLAHLVGVSKAKELIFTGMTIDAAEALRIGLVNKVVERRALEQTVAGVAEAINENSYYAVRAAKRAINAKAKSDYAAEKKNFLECFKHPDKAEGIEAFLEHRKPKFL